MQNSGPSPESLIAMESADNEKVPKKRSIGCCCGVKVIVPVLVTMCLLLALAWRAGLNTVFGAIDVGTPDYKLLHKGHGYEIRQYPPSTAIATGSASRNSFMRLAGFIGVVGKPQNDRNQKIAMTAPVVSIPSSEEMQFILPSNVNSSAPQPTAKGVRLVTRPSSVLAVETFSGSWSTHAAEARAKKLRQRVQADGYVLEQAPWEYFRYNPPWTLPFFRTNEVAVPIQWPPVAKSPAATAVHKVGNI